LYRVQGRFRVELQMARLKVETGKLNAPKASTVEERIAASH
jgi:hypothetical protein